MIIGPLTSAVQINLRLIKHITSQSLITANRTATSEFDQFGTSANINAPSFRHQSPTPCQ
jgi:hypothetical protein